MVNPVFTFLRYANRWLRNTFKLYDAEDKIIAEAHQYWNDPSKVILPQYTHSRGAGMFQDEEKWLSIGRQSLAIYQELERCLPPHKPLSTILEWGCGGGANAIHFAPLAKTFYGLDISADVLKECARQLTSASIQQYHMVEIDAAHPEEALQHVQQPIDLLFCVNVMEVFPSKTYTERIINIASKMLATGGIALLQYKYTTPRWETQPKRWNYASDPPNMTTFWIDEFWQLCIKHQLTPKVMKLLPPLNEQDIKRRYVYLLCVKE